MTLTSKIVARAKSQLMTGAYLLRATSNRPLDIIVAGSHIKIRPDGEIAELLWKGTFEQIELGLVSRFLQPGMTFIDVGANSGIYSLVASPAVGNSGRVVAFEPSAKTFPILQHNIAVNFARNVRIERMALTDVSGQGTLVSPKGYGDGYRYFELKHEEERDSDETVQCTTLDSYADTHGIASIHMLKIDVEGGELGVLKGARELLSRSSNPLILFECYEPWCNRLGYSAASLVNYVFAQDFCIYTWDHTTGKFTDDAECIQGNPILWACKDPRVLLRMQDTISPNAA